MPTAVVALDVEGQSADDVALGLRVGPVRVFSRIQQDRVLLDLRSVLDEDDALLVDAVRAVVAVLAG